MEHHEQPDGEHRDELRLHESVIVSRGTVALRDLIAEDIEAIVSYWFTSDDEFLDFMGVDRDRLGTQEDTRQRLRRALRTGDPNQKTLAFGITLNDQLVGYSLLNRYSPDINYGHWHITNPDLRGTGISTALYPYRMRTYFEAVPIERLIHQTRTRNTAVNQMLDKYVRVTETRHIEQPDGVALPGEFHLRYVLREDLPTIFARAAELREFGR